MPCPLGLWNPPRPFPSPWHAAHASLRPAPALSLLAGSQLPVSPCVPAPADTQLTQCQPLYLTMPFHLGHQGECQGHLGKQVRDALDRLCWKQGALPQLFPYHRSGNPLHFLPECLQVQPWPPASLGPSEKQPFLLSWAWGYRHHPRFSRDWHAWYGKGGI